MILSKHHFLIIYLFIFPTNGHFRTFATWAFSLKYATDVTHYFTLCSLYTGNQIRSKLLSHAQSTTEMSKNRVSISPHHQDPQGRAILVQRVFTSAWRLQAVYGRQKEPPESTVNGRRLIGGRTEPPWPRFYRVIGQHGEKKPAMSTSEQFFFISGPDAKSPCTYTLHTNVSVCARARPPRPSSIR